MADGANAIEVEGLGKSFDGKAVLAGVDFAVARGSVFGYIGPNGAGKSTTVKILVGMLQSFQGTARVAGVDVRADPLGVKRRIGYVPENANLYEVLTPFEYLTFAGRLHGLAEQLIQRRALGLLEGFELAGRAHSRIGSLSKGMRQKVLLSAALLHDPDILFLDEPLAGLDVRSVIVIKELIRGFAAAGRTIFYCSHVMDVVERVCDRIAILANGSIAAIGSFEELAARAAETSLEQVFRRLTGGGDEGEQAAAVLAVLRDG